MAIVSVAHLSKSYGRRPPALRDVTLEVGGGVTGLLGPNGAGKSTLIQCVLGLLRDYRGSASVLGLDAREDRLAIRRRVGYMPESDALLPRMSGVTSVRYLAELTGMSRRHALRRAHECLHYVGLSEALYRKCEEYSTGMRQRLKLAQALVHDPEVLFLDEPVSGMDPAGRDEFLRLIRSLARDHGKHVVWSSHMLPDVQRVADGILVLDRGELRGSFRLEDLSGPSGRLRVEGTGDGTAFDREVERRGLSTAHVATGAGEGEPEAGRFERIVSGAGLGVGPVLAAADAAEARVRSLTPVVERLEDVFDRLVAGDGAVPRGAGGSP